ncbi:hypothetical protein KXD40_003295 [Peronospora effusa]|nr:hypothetical protein KXD40_003295 [Peronospora effusa]
MTKVMQGKDFLKLLEEYLARATATVIHGVFFADVVEDFTDTDMVVQIVVFRELDDIVTVLEAYDATFREKYYIPAVAESKRPHYVKLIDLTKLLSM